MKALTGSQEQQDPNEMEVDTKARHYDQPVKDCSYTTDVQDTMLTYLSAFTPSRGNLLSLSLSVSVVSLKVTAVTAAVIDLLKVIFDPYFVEHIFTNQVKSIAKCPKVSNHIV